MKKGEARIIITENVASAPAFQATISSEPECGYSGGIVKNSPGEILFRIKPTKDPCYYEIVQKNSKPSQHELKYTPVDIESCCVFSLMVERDYYFVKNKTYINFKKSLKKPFYFEIKDQTKYSVHCYITQQRNFAHELYESNWPLSNGYQENLAGQFFIKLSIDEKEVKAMRNNCVKKKR